MRYGKTLWHGKPIRRGKRRGVGPFWLRAVVFFALCVLFGLAAAGAVEAVRAGSLSQLYVWAAKYTDCFLLSVLLYVSLTALIGSLTGRLWIAGAAVSAAGLLLALVDFFKLSIDGAPLTLSDFGLAGRAGHVAGLAGNLAPPLIFWQMALYLALGVLSLFLLDPLMRLFPVAGKGKKQRLERKTWAVRLGVSAALCLILFSGAFTDGLGNLFQVDVVTALDPFSSHNTYGLTVSLWRERFLRQKPPPEGYGPAFMRDVLNQVDRLLDAHPAADAAEESAADPDGSAVPDSPAFGPERPAAPDSPNVIIVLSESFFDPTRLPGVSFDRDPAANFHALRAESISGPFFSHYLGYGTGYLEISMQTGFAGPDLGAGTNLCFMKEDFYDLFDSLAEQYTNTGYYTAEMLHAFDNSLYNRTVTYPRMGYAKCLYSKDIQNLGMENAGLVYRGYYMSDSYLFKGVLHEMRAVNESGKRAFLYAITMGNHQPFQPDKFIDPDDPDSASHWEHVRTKSSKLTEDELAILRVGIEGIYLADQALRELTDALRRYPEPTVVAFFGDHRPTLPMPDGETVYTKLGLSPGSDAAAWTTEQLGDLYSSDYLIWANDAALLQGQAGSVRPEGILSFGPAVLRLTRRTVSRYWGLLERASEAALVSTEIYFADGRGVVSRSREEADLTREEKKILSLRDCVLYDALYGKQYITREMNLPAP